MTLFLFFFFFNVLWRCLMEFLCELLPVHPVLNCKGEFRTVLVSLMSN